MLTTTSLGPDIHTSMALRTYEEITYQHAYYYHFLGRTHVWNSTDTPSTEMSFNTESDTAIRDSMIYLKRIYPNDISLAITRYEWQAPNGVNFFGQVYQQWDHTKDMSDKMFYCVTVPEYNVYKCLYNNNGGLSTTKPNKTTLIPEKYSDNYVWKYMYTIPPFKIQRFVSDTYIPVQRSLSDMFYNKGAIEQTVVINAGSNYSRARNTSLIVTDNTTDPTPAVATLIVNEYGTITNISISSSGSGYLDGGPSSVEGKVYASVEITINTTVGHGAIIKAHRIINAEDGTIGGILDFDIIEGGYSYTSDDTIAFTVKNANIIPVINSDGAIANVFIESGGYGYSASTTITVHKESNTSQNAIDASLKPIIVNGSIVGVTIENTGRNYDAGSNVSISVVGDGSGATFLPIISSTGTILSAIVNTPGKNYSWIQLTVHDISNTPGSGAEINGIVNISDYDSNQAIIEQSTIRGSINAIVITNPGNSVAYDIAPDITIEGDGSGCIARAILDNNKYLSHIEVTSFGSGYTYANVSLRSNGILDESFSAYVILPPITGHGFDAPTELFAKTLAVYSSFYEDTDLNIINKEYRQHGIIVNPVNTLSNERIRLSTELLLYDVSFPNISGINVDNILVSNNRKYRVISIDSINNSLRLQQLTSVYSVPSNEFKNVSENLSYTVRSINNIPKTNKYSGRIFYISNDFSFSPSDSQYIVIKSFIEF